VKIERFKLVGMRAEICGCLAKNMIVAEKRPIGNEGQIVVHFIFVFDDIDASRLHPSTSVSKKRAQESDLFWQGFSLVQL
jgi:hypothetical protein